MRFLKITCQGTVNSFRVPEFHTYHKTLPLPPKTTIGGLIGSALGLSPQQVNSDWLLSRRFKVGICGTVGGKAGDLWQIRKYEQKQIAAFLKGDELYPFKTAVIVRELLFRTTFSIYLTFTEDSDFDFLETAFKNPAWALSLGREDELIKILKIEQVDLLEKEGLVFKNTVLPGDLNVGGYTLDKDALSGFVGKNLLNDAPVVYRLPLAFQYEGEERTPVEFGFFTFVSNLGVISKQTPSGFRDNTDNHCFQIF